MREITINDLHYVYHFTATHVSWLKDDYYYFLPRIDDDNVSEEDLKSEYAQYKIWL